MITDPKSLQIRMGTVSKANIITRNVAQSPILIKGVVQSEMHIALGVGIKLDVKASHK